MSVKDLCVGSGGVGKRNPASVDDAVIEGARKVVTSAVSKYKAASGVADDANAGAVRVNVAGAKWA